jgi:hypothetical protein
MNKECKIAFEKAKKIIFEKKEDLVNHFPLVHEIEDGFIVKFFSKWEECEETKLKVRKIKSLDNPEEIIYLGFMPKGLKINAESKNYNECIICLDGNLMIDIEGDIKYIESFSKLCIGSNKKYCGESLLDSYFIMIGSPKLP